MIIGHPLSTSSFSWSPVKTATFYTAELPMNVQQRVFERQLYLHFLSRFAKIWSITYQRIKEAQTIQFWFLLALEYLHANQAPDPCLNVRVTQKLNIVNLQTSKGLECHALAKGHFFQNRFISSGLFLLKKFKSIMTHCISGT